MLKLFTIAKEPTLGYEPSKPSPPIEYFKCHRSIELKYGHEYSLKDIEVLLPDNISLDDLRIKHTSYDNGCDVYEYVAIYYIENVKNASYQQDLERYNKAVEFYDNKLKEYELEKNAYVSDLKEYFAWWDANGYKDTSHEIALRKKYKI